MSIKLVDLPLVTLSELRCLVFTSSRPGGRLGFHLLSLRSLPFLLSDQPYFQEVFCQILSFSSFNHRWLWLFRRVLSFGHRWLRLFRQFVKLLAWWVPLIPVGRQAICLHRLLHSERHQSFNTAALLLLDVRGTWLVSSFSSQVESHLSIRP